MVLVYSSLILYDGVIGSLNSLKFTFFVIKQAVASSAAVKASFQELRETGEEMWLRNLLEQISWHTRELYVKSKA